MAHYISEREMAEARAQALTLAVQWYTIPNTRGELWPTVERMERYLLTGNPDEPAPAPEPEPQPPAEPTKGERIIAAAHAWYSRIPEGQNIGAWADGEEMELINAVRAALGLPEFDWNGDGPWKK